MNTSKENTGKNEQNQSTRRNARTGFFMLSNVNDYCCTNIRKMNVMGRLDSNRVDTSSVKILNNNVKVEMRGNSGAV